MLISFTKKNKMDHGVERPFPCPECSFTCKTKQQLNEHRRKHSVSEILVTMALLSYSIASGIPVTLTRVKC